MKFGFAAVCGMAISLIGSDGNAYTGPAPAGVPRLNHVFIVMMENHTYAQIVNNPNAPFLNALIKQANVAANYFAIAHPSLPNYLEIAGGSNFNILSDAVPDWHDTACKPNLATGVTDGEALVAPACPISGTGTDAATPVLDTTNETSGPPGDIEIDGKMSFPAAANITGVTIADQLTAKGLTWKSYQESLPISGADLVSSSDGEYTNNTDFTNILPTLNPPLTSADIVSLYASKHNPFVYFKSGQTAAALRNTVGFNQFYADLAAGAAPSFAFIAPNQCNDQHGRENGTVFCNYDPDDNGTQAGLNPALIQAGDQSVQRIVTAIRNSPAWHDGRAAIVVVWDENDGFTAPETNQVLLLVDKNYGTHGKSSAVLYTHFSLLKSIEAGFGLPCLNHACDGNVKAMSDLFSN
jgi:hypothetical protein